ncbi:unnamed protein product [Orchesella dallaii]|uniref:Uncharacterized protein n=1 Tax=Orchesella dallaii TaxID=48710 RepID=A0ABP1R487_9HEXA
MANIAIVMPAPRVNVPDPNNNTPMEPLRGNVYPAPQLVLVLVIVLVIVFGEMVYTGSIPIE